jgi:hypothetical protein
VAVDRESCYAALATRLQQYVGPLLAAPVMRKLPTYSNIDAIMQPALAVIAEQETVVIGGPELPIWTLHATAVIYARAGGNLSSTAETTLARIVQAIDDALHANLEDLTDGSTLVPGQQQAWTTLGGVVRWARPGGPVTYDSGQIEGQAIAEFPVEMLPYPG